MKKKIIILLLFIVPALNAQWLEVSKDQHHLVYDSGKPFIWIGDTAWELIHRCNKEEIEMYLNNRVGKGFNVIQTVVLAERDGLNTPNSYNEKPLFENNPLTPNEKYFEHVDWIIKKVDELNMFIALLPTWGDKWHDEGATIFDTIEKAEKYCEWLSDRYKDQPNIIWILGGDRNPDSEKHQEIIRAMARGLRNGESKKHLITFHPMGDKTSSIWFLSDKWLDFNMAQTGHWRRHEKVYKMISDDYNLEPAKPCINGEPQYEDIPVRFDVSNERFTAYDIREAAYWSILSGAFGHTYGNNNIWQMWTEERESVLGARLTWKQAIHHPGSTQMGYIRKIFESRPFLELVPDQQILSDYFGQDYDNIRTARDKNGSFLIVYIPQGQTTRLRIQKLKAESVSGYWFNPREGISIKIEQFENPNKDMDISPPTSGPRTDWILILDDASKNYPDPIEFEFTTTLK